MDNELSINTTLKNQEYNIILKLGSGNYGITYKAIRTNDKAEVVIKELFPKLTVSRFPNNKVKLQEEKYKFNYDKLIAAFNQEIETIKKIDNKHVVKVLDSFKENNTIYFVMPYYSGETLEIYNNNKILTLKDKIKIVISILDGLEVVHKEKIIHRDLKPQNIYMADVNNEKIPIILDFGSSKKNTEDETNNVNDTVTDGFSPIEFYNSKDKDDFFSDVYAVAAILYYLVIGDKPTKATERTLNDHKKIQDETNRVIDNNNEMNSELKQILKKGIAFESTKRYLFVKDFKKALSGFLKKLEPSKPKIIKKKKTTKSSNKSNIKKSKKLKFLFLSVVFILTTGLILYIGHPIYEIYAEKMNNDRIEAQFEIINKEYLTQKDSIIPMIKIPAGKFISTGYGDEHPKKEITLTHDFMMSKYEITIQNYCDILNYYILDLNNTIVSYDSLKSEDDFNMKYRGNTHQLSFDADTTSIELNLFETSGIWQGTSHLITINNNGIKLKNGVFVANKKISNYPIMSVSWVGATFYCNVLSKMIGYSELYNLLDGTCNVYPNIKTGYRLPTRAEWEYTAKYDDNRIYPWGNDPPNSTHLEKDDALGLAGLHHVGFYSSGNSKLGISNMSGNVSEWTNDSEYSDYDFISNTLPDTLMISCNRIVCGGWFFASEGEPSERCDFYRIRDDIFFSGGIGFRIARPIITDLNNTLNKKNMQFKLLTDSLKQVEKEKKLKLAQLERLKNKKEKLLNEKKRLKFLVKDITQKKYSFYRKKINMVDIPAGRFLKEDFSAKRNVNLKFSYKVGKYEITNKEFCDILNYALKKDELLVEESNSNLKIKNSKGISKLLYGITDRDNKIGLKILYKSNKFVVVSGKERNPITNVTWYGGAFFCNMLSRLSGLTEMYNLSEWSCIRYNTGFRLPTGKEWEYFAYYPTNWKLPWDECSSFASMRKNGDYYSRIYELPRFNSINKDTLYKNLTTNIKNIGYHSPYDNTFSGLSDMIGNAYEICHDIDDMDTEYILEPTSDAFHIHNNDIYKGTDYISATKSHVGLAEEEFSTSLEIGFRIVRPIQKSDEEIINCRLVKLKSRILRYNAQKFTVDFYSGRASNDYFVDAFYIGKFEVSKTQYKKIMGSDYTAYTKKGKANGFSWFDAVLYCNKLSKIEGLNKAYIIHKDTVECDFAKNGYRLPTYMEYNIAYYEGKVTRNARGKIIKEIDYSESDIIDSIAWYRSNSFYKIHHGASKKSNNIGMYDMLGNYSEWIWDDEPYKNESPYHSKNKIAIDGNHLKYGGNITDEKKYLTKYPFTSSHSNKDSDHNYTSFRVSRSFTKKK